MHLMQGQRENLVFAAIAATLVAALVFTLVPVLRHDNAIVIGQVSDVAVHVVPVAPARVTSHVTLGSEALAYSPGWELIAGRTDGRFHGSSLRSFRAGARATLDFHGVGVRIFGVVGRGGGIGAVTIDGIPARDVDFFAARKATHQIVFISPPLPPGQHHLAITVKAEPDRLMARYVNIDGVAYDS